MGPAWLWLLGTGALASVHCQPFSARGGKRLEAPQVPSGRLSEPVPAYRKITPTITNFALRLYKQLAADATGNILFSPVGISATLALLSLASGADTSAQVLEGLGFNLTELPEADLHRGFQSLLHTLGRPSPKLELKVDNSLFLDQRLKPQQRFLDSIQELYGAFAFSANFSDSPGVRMQVSEYVRAQTYGLVADSLQAFAPDTLMALLNFIFFKAKWKQTFHRYPAQKRGSFSADARTALRVPMMHQKEMHRFLYDQELACTVLQIEYSGSALALLILPDPGKMKQVEAALQPETLRKWDQLLLPSVLDLHLPRFSTSGTYTLEEILSRMGLTDISGLKADFSGIGGQLSNVVSRVSHKAVVDMSERGTEAGAASGLPSQPQAPESPAGPHTPFNRPFLLLIWHVTTESLLFLGKVVNPAAG